jgi:hypothetical protein
MPRAFSRADADGPLGFLRISANVNGHSGIVNNDSGKRPKSFTFERNPCSRSAEMAVHDHPKSVFTFRRNLCSRSAEIPSFLQNMHSEHVVRSKDRRWRISSACKLLQT